MIWLLPIGPALAGLALAVAAPRRRVATGLAGCAVLLATGLFAVFGAARAWTGTVAWSDTLVLSAAFVPAAAVMAVLVPLIALPVMAYAAAHEDERGLARLAALLLLFVAGMEVLVIAADLLTLLIGWEIVGACSWALIGHTWRDAGSPATGLYAFIATRLGDLGLFAAAMALFAGTGSFAFDDMARLSGTPLAVAVSGILLSAAAKSGQLPFSPWLFRAMAGPTAVSALLHAATMVAAGAFLLIRLHSHLAAAPGFAASAMAIGAATALAGGFVAIVQPHAKKLLAASTSAHFGLMFVAAGAGFPGAALLHLAAHAAFKALLFLAAGTAGRRGRSFLLHRLGFAGTMPLVAGCAVLGAIALAGIPPSGGGWSKELVTAAASHASPWAGIAVMVAGAFTGAYAARWQLLVFGLGDRSTGSGKPNAAETAAIAVLAAFVLAMSVFWIPGFHAAAAGFLAMELPVSTTAGKAASLAFLAVGLAAGTGLARQWPTLGTSGPAERMAAWLGLPAVIDALVVRPFTGLCRIACRVDDGILDALPRSLARAAHAVSPALSRADRTMIDGCIKGLAAATTRLARIGRRFCEGLADGIPQGSARLVGIGGSDARRLQTGMSHHYYAAMAAGVLAAVVVLAWTG
ncbi:MAG: NADH-quinone oxidoreductase subunit L [Brucellaceae bacterium]|nr:NADH-quinone oxidoreductase subunit L [Notoacmeibacter sp.]MCC0027085.1 NADH-quinone oxidoreductase subunit L [Brucellaceae bacterium]